MERGGTTNVETKTMATEDTKREIGHDEFDPVGTLVLIAVYFVILVVMWIVMWRIEFIGNGPTVIG
jgi:hypothetical protein